MPEQEVLHRGRRFFCQSEKTIAEFLLKIAMQIEFGPRRVDQNFAGIVVDKEPYMPRFRGNFHPLSAPAALLPLPCNCSVEVTFTFADRRDDRVWTSRQPTDLDQPQRCAPHFRDRSIENKVPPLEEKKSLVKNVEAGEDSDDAPCDGARIGRSSQHDGKD